MNYTTEKSLPEAV